jgi:hypothetical protein
MKNLRSPLTATPSGPKRRVANGSLAGRRTHLPADPAHPEARNQCSRANVGKGFPTSTTLYEKSKPGFHTTHRYAGRSRPSGETDPNCLREQRRHRHSGIGAPQGTHTGGGGSASVNEEGILSPRNRLVRFAKPSSRLFHEDDNLSTVYRFARRPLL